MSNPYDDYYWWQLIGMGFISLKDDIVNGLMWCIKKASGCFKKHN